MSAEETEQESLKEFWDENKLFLSEKPIGISLLLLFPLRYGAFLMSARDSPQSKKNTSLLMPS